MNSVEDLFMCPVCKGKMKFVQTDIQEFKPRCQNQSCGETFPAEYVRGFWAGYQKAKREQ